MTEIVNPLWRIPLQQVQLLANANIHTIKGIPLHKKCGFRLMIFSVNVTKSEGGFGHIYWRNP